MTDKIKVLIVDDASFMVKALHEILASDPQIEVVGSARNGREAIDKIKQLRPDVITLDVDMPIMDGIQAVRHIMIECPVPIVMLSSLFKHGDITFEALRLGVVDFLPKPSGAISTDIHTQRMEVIDRVKLAASVSLHNIQRVRIRRMDVRETLSSRYQFRALEGVIVIGTTLGGPGSLIRLLNSLPPDLPAAIVAAQEISPRILPEFVNEFDLYTPWKVESGLEEKPLQQGVCYICTLRQPMMLGVNERDEPVLRPAQGAGKPLDTLFSSAAAIFGQHTVGVLMTGHGNDGHQGFAQIQRGGGVTLAQETRSCVYPNLTQCAIERGVVDRVVSLDELSSQLVAALTRSEDVGQLGG